MTRILCEERDVRIDDSTGGGDAPGRDGPAGAGDALWLDRDDVERVTGWTWKPEGLCRGDTCVPLPRGSASIVRGDRLDVAASWRHAGRPVVHDSTSRLWVLGEGASARAEALRSLEAPDFALPDLGGHLHRLSDHRGKRIFLATWASW